MARNSIPNEQSSQILNFLKNNMKVFLKILSGNTDSRVATEDFLLLSNDINLLNTVFYVAEVAKGGPTGDSNDPKAAFNFAEKDMPMFNINKNAPVSS
jgi:hypothetical protein